MWYPKIDTLANVLNEMKAHLGMSKNEDLDGVRYFSHKGKEIDPSCVPQLMNKTATVEYYLIKGQVTICCFLKPLFKKDNVKYKEA